MSAVSFDFALIRKLSACQYGHFPLSPWCRLQMALLFSSVPCDDITATIGQAFSQVKRRKWLPDVTIFG